MQLLKNCIGPTIRSGRESWCLPYARCFTNSILKSALYMILIWYKSKTMFSEMKKLQGHTNKKKFFQKKILIDLVKKQLILFVFIRRLPSYQHISKKKVWKNDYTTISLWSPTNSGSNISVSLKGFRICNNICLLFWGFGSYIPVCLKKSPKTWSLLLKSVLKLKL